VVAQVAANRALAENTAIFVTFDEGGGYYDSGYVQQLDFFGDGTRIPMIVVSRFSRGGHITHSYTDHVSTLKFIEANWGLRPITAAQPGQSAQPSRHHEPLCANESAGDRRPDGHVQLQRAVEPADVGATDAVQ
jgi:phospholipase C